MGKFLEVEKSRQAQFKKSSCYFSQMSRAEGTYRGESYDFCLPEGCADENLFVEIRRESKNYFKSNGISWHMGKNGSPSAHLCSSQVCCINFLFPFMDKPEALTSLLRPVFPDIKRVVPMVEDKSEGLVSFEWIGKENYLKEKIRKNGKRTRGANCTSADAAVQFECEDGSNQIALIEWKYTESYGGENLCISKNGTDRTKIYKHIYDSEDFPLKKELLRDFNTLFYEPFYQLFRQQALSAKMESAKESGADRVSVLHIAPEKNTDFRKITSLALKSHGNSALEVWEKLLKKPDRFTSATTESLFGCFPIKDFPALTEWWEYITARYPWTLEPGSKGISAAQPYVIMSGVC